MSKTEKKKAQPEKKAEAQTQRQTSLIKFESGGVEFLLPGRSTPTQLMLFEKLPFAEVSQTAIKIRQLHDATRWWSGDLLNYGEANFGEEYAQIQADTGLEEETARKYQYVNSHVPPGNRMKELTWSHHVIVAPFPPEEQKALLQYAMDKNLSVREFKEYLKGSSEESEDGSEGDGAKESTSCEICADPNGAIRACPKCASVATKAISTIGVEGAIELMKRRPSKPQLDMLIWAFEHVHEPENLSAEESIDWRARYEAMGHFVRKAAKAD